MDLVELISSHLVPDVIIVQKYFWPEDVQARDQKIKMAAMSKVFYVRHIAHSETPLWYLIFLTLLPHHG